MPEYRIGQAAELLGVSVDTMRRWADQGRLPTSRTDTGQRIVDGAALARFATELAPPPAVTGVQSARNRLPGIVTGVEIDGVAATVEIQAGRHRLISLLTREAVEEMGLAPGVLAVGVVKATNVIVELPVRP